MLDYTVFLSLFTLVCCASPSPGRNEVASPGDSPALSCSLPDASGVKQVTWQRLNRDQSLVTMATFNENFRAQVTEAYADKVEVRLAKLNHTTIVFRNITFSDEGCYTCTFNVYPSGTERRTTCLIVQGISEMNTSWTLRRPFEKEVVVSCSATGKPAPNITWNSTGKEMESPVKNNEDGSATVTRNLTLPLSQFRGKPVECRAQSGEKTICKHITMSDDEAPDIENGRTNRRYLATVAVVVICVICAVAMGLVLHRRRNKYGKDTIDTIDTIA